MIERANIPLSEEFTHHEWFDYDAFESETRAHLHSQRHVDVRTFTSDSGEEWSTGEFGYLEEHENYPGLEIGVIEGVTVTESVTPKHTVNLLTGFKSDDLLTFALPNYPGFNINAVQSFIEITSQEEGNFLSETVTIPFAAGLSQPEAALPPAENPPFTKPKAGEWVQRFRGTLGIRTSNKEFAAGNYQFVVPRSRLEENNLDLARITGIRFTLKGKEGTGSSTLTIMGLKLVQSEEPWVCANVDFDNWNGRLHKPNPLNGNLEEPPALLQGKIWKAAPLPGVNDPQPIDGEFAVSIYTGSQNFADNFTLFFREQSQIFQTQLDLDGTFQMELDGHEQPDLGEAEFLPRAIEEFDSQTMEEMDRKESMKALERREVPHPIEHSWVYFELNWGVEAQSVVMANSNSTSPGYIFPVTLKKNENYLFVCTLEGSSGRARLFKLNEDLSVEQEPIFDSQLLEDDAVFRRRKGRMGWVAELGDGDTFVRSIRPRGVSFAEYVSEPLRSYTPVDGAELFADYSPNLQLWNKVLSQYPVNSPHAVVAIDTKRTLSGESYRLSNKGFVNQGFETGLIDFLDLDQTVIKFALWFTGPARAIEEETRVVKGLYPARNRYPSTKLYPAHDRTFTENLIVNSIIAELVSPEGYVVPLELPEIEPNQWQQIVVRPPANEVIQSGPYTLRIFQDTKLPTTWWIDELKIYQRAVQWEARSVADDAWNSNYAPWTEFGDIINKENQGVLLSPRGKELQLRAKARQQNAYVKQPKLIPRYAALGRLVWPENELSGLTAPTASYKATGAFNNFAFEDESTEGSGAIVSREWIFGDGSRETGNRKKVGHTYATLEETTEIVTTLVITDRYGQSATHEVVVEVS